MDFFELPQPVDDDEEEDWQDPTTPYLPVVLPYSHLLAKTDEAVVLLAGLQVFPDGVSIEINSYTRGAARKRIERNYRGQGGRIMADGVVPEEFLRIGVAFPDGKKATNLESPWHRSEDAPEPDCGIESGRSSGGGGEYSESFWIWPLPTDGDFTIVCEWPVANILQTFTVMDGAEIRMAGESARLVWEDEKDKPSHMTAVQWIKTHRPQSDESSESESNS